jgi:hypothetical protein
MRIVSHCQRTARRSTGCLPACLGTPVGSGADISERPLDRVGQSAGSPRVDFATARENKNVPLPFGMANHRVFAGSTDCRPEDDVANAVVRLLRHGRLDAGFLEALHQLRSG